jgi:hypothetical protein
MNQNVNYLGGGGSLVLQTIPDEWDRILYGLPIAIFCLSRRFERSACRTRLKHIPFFMTTPFLFFPPNAAMLVSVGLFWSLVSVGLFWSLVSFAPPLPGCLFPQWGIESLRTASTLVGWNECLSVPGGCVRGVFRVSRWVGVTLCVDGLLFRVCSFGAWRKGAGRTTLH